MCWAVSTITTLPGRHVTGPSGVSPPPLRASNTGHRRVAVAQRTPSHYPTPSTPDSEVTMQLHETTPAAPFVMVTAEQDTAKDRALLRPHDSREFKIYLDFFSTHGMTETQIEASFLACWDKRDQYIAESGFYTTDNPASCSTA